MPSPPSGWPPTASDPMGDAIRPGPPNQEPRASLSLLDYRRRVVDLYADVRAHPGPDGHARWRAGRDHLFASHPDSPVPAGHRSTHPGIPTWPYDPAVRFEVAVEPSAPTTILLDHSGDGATRARAVGTLIVPFPAGPATLTLFRLEQYGDQLFLPFTDATSGRETYGGGRYLIDTAKGADLGSTATHLVVDFNFAYHPSCVHDPTWSCPLAPLSNAIPYAVRAGERLPGEQTRDPGGGHS